MELQTNTPKSGHGKRSQEQDIALLHHQAIQEDWISGYRPGEIAARQGISIELVHGGIRSVRRQLYEDNQATLAEHSEQSVAVFRRLETRLWQEYEKLGGGKAGLQILAEIRKAEESVAKVRGILSNRVIADVVHHVKLYDFQDKFPNANGKASDEAATKIIESESHALSPIPKESIPDVEMDTIIMPDFEDTSVVIMPNGDIIDIEKAIQGNW